MASNMMTSAPLTFRPRTHEDWQIYRPEIERLYRDDQLKLRDVKKIMERDYGFVASYCSLFGVFAAVKAD